VTTYTRARPVPLGAEIALAFAAGAAFFAVVAVTVAAAESDLLVVVLGLVYLAATAGIARRWGIVYAAPAAVAGLLAYDWYQFPPTHANEFPDADDLVELLAYLGVGVLVGELAALASRRAHVSEAARSELADEQAALRRVATRVARGEPADVIFAAVTEEVGRLLHADLAGMTRFVTDDSLLAVATWAAAGEHPEARGVWPTEGERLSPAMLRTARPVREDDWESASGPIAAFVRDELGVRSTVGSPIVVEGRVWGGLFVHLKGSERFPADAESRVREFTELVATAISNSTSREQLSVLADEQAALRRVATLVAEDVPPAEVFAAVAREMGRLLDVDATHIVRFGEGNTATGVGSWTRTGDPMPLGVTAPLDGTSLVSEVLQTRRPARRDRYADEPGSVVDEQRRKLGIRSAVAAPIVVEGRLWGAMGATSQEEEPLPPDTESRIAAFTELVATAISNTEARVEVARLADEQAALRRVATLVARNAPPNEVWQAIAEEVHRLFSPDAGTGLLRLEPDGRLTLVGVKTPLGTEVGSSFVPEEGAAAVAVRTARPARVDTENPDPRPPDSGLPEFGSPAWRNLFRTQVATPIVVEGRLWGVTVTSWMEEKPPTRIEARVTQFTDLLATAIANADSRAELAASRARLVDAADAERRRVVRDLHDGAQQRLVHTVVTLKLAQRDLRGAGEAAARVEEALAHAERATAELRELAHGIHPAVLTRGGLRAAVDALASRMPVPVVNAVSVDRLDPAVEATAYFLVAEALTNVSKHARATHASVTAHADEGELRLEVRDDGVGGAHTGGSGLVGLADRLAVLDGRLRVESPRGGGTSIAAVIPLAGAGGRASPTSASGEAEPSLWRVGMETGP
jgi:signal transduction histidine kinase